MSDLTSIEKAKLEKLLGMESGYVLDFSNRSFREFISENIGIDITDPKYNYASNSKANRLRALWKIEDNKIIGKLLSTLVEYWKWQKTSNNLITQAEQSLFEECVRIIERLRENSDYLNRQSKEHERQELRIKKEYRLSQLLVMFEKLGLSSDHQQRGFMLQDLLTHLTQNSVN